MITEAFKRWASRVRFGTPKVKRGMRRAFSLYEKPERDLLGEIKAVNEESRPGVYGSSVLGSRIIKLNPKTLGENHLMWATSAIHEAEHGVHNRMENAATIREFRFLGRLYKRSIEGKNNVMAKRTLRAAAIAMNQRKRMVEAKYLNEDKELLENSGFSERAADALVGMTV